MEFFEPLIERNPKRDIQIIRKWVDGNYVVLQAFQSLNDGDYQWVTTDFFDTDVNDKILEHWDVIAEYKDSTPSVHTTIDRPTEVVDLDKTDANKEVVRNLIFHGLMKGGDPSRLPEFINVNKYFQHNPEIPDGLEHFQELASDPNRPLNYEDIVLMVGQVNFVATLSRAWYRGENESDSKGKEYAQVDIFRLEDGKVVEHWDNVEPVPENDVNGGKF